MGLREDIKNILDKDPAARSSLEVLLCYPGLHAIMIHRIGHKLWGANLYTLARMVSQFGRFLTGIEIHPGATIGKRVIIDHGMGVVVGETTTVGDDVVLYQGVTLGAGSDARGGVDARGKKRHPTLGNGVVVGSGAEIQGPVTVGDNVRVASGSIVLRDVPADSIVVGVPGRVIYHRGKKVDSDKVPDIEAEALKAMKNRVDELEKRLEVLASASGLAKPPGPVDSDNLQNGGTGEDPVDVFLHGAGI